MRTFRINIEDMPEEIEAESIEEAEKKVLENIDIYELNFEDCITD